MTHPLHVHQVVTRIDSIHFVPICVITPSFNLAGSVMHVGAGVKFRRPSLVVLSCFHTAIAARNRSRESAVLPLDLP